MCLFVRSLCYVENAAGKEINDSSLAPHHFYFKSKVDTDNMEIEDLVAEGEPMATDAAAPSPAAGAPPQSAPKAPAKKATGRGGATTVKTLELRVASLEADNKVLTALLEELMVEHRTKEAAAEATAGTTA